MTARRLAAALAALVLAPLPCRLPLVAQQAKPFTAAELAQAAPMDPKVTVGTLPNGLTYYIYVNRYPEHRAELRLAVKVGSVVEDPDQRGLAHVAEHMAFNGTPSFPKNELVHYLQSIGSRFGADVNAYTGFDETVYMLQVPTDTGKFLDTGMKILSEWAHSVSYDDAEIDAERGVVTEEWRLGRGAGARMRDRQFPVLLRDSRYADRLVIGTLESLQGFTHDALRRFYRKWYRPDLMAVVAVGDFDKDAVEALIRREFGGIPRGAPLERPTYPVPAHDSVYVSITTDPEATNSSFTLYQILPKRSYLAMQGFRDRYIERLGMGMLNARFQEITQKPNPPFAFASSGRGYFVGSADSYSLFGGVEPGGILKGFEAALTEEERAARFGFTQGELDRVLADNARNQEGLMREEQTHFSATRAAELLRNFLNGEEVLGTIGEYEAYQRINPFVTLAEVNAATQALLRSGSPVIVASAPAKPGVTVPTEAQLLATYRSVKSKQLEPYRDSVITAPLVARPPAPAAIVASRTIPELGLTEWKLANGVTVVLKPTDFLKDQVILRGQSPGGSSLVPDSLALQAQFASTAAAIGGVATFSAVDLQKMLSGKRASAMLSVGDRSEYANGSSGADDIEEMLQLVYLRFTAPRRDPGAFQAFVQQNSASMANINASPMKAFSDTVTVAMADGHPRVPPMSPELLQAVDLDKALAIYRERFADASDFTFFMVGAFDLDSVRPMVQRYLGNLPATHRVEQGKDTGVHPPSGHVEKLVRKGSEPQSRTFMAFTGDVTWSEDAAYVASSLGELLTNRLIDNLREKLGGTYSVGASVSLTRDEPHRFTATVQFGSAPDRAEELTQAVLKEVKDLAANGPTEAELTKVREGQLRSRETALRTNFFWIGSLGTAWQYGDDPRDILKYPERVAGLTADKIQRAAGTYFDTTNYLHVTLLPGEVVP